MNRLTRDRGARHCSYCGEWFARGAAVASHELVHTRPPAPPWCTCTHPETVTAYGFPYCGRCHRGYRPKGAA